MKTLIFLMIAILPSWGAPLLKGRGSELELPDAGVHSHTEPYHRSPKIFNLNQFDLGDITVEGRVTGNKKVSIGHSVGVSNKEPTAAADQESPSVVGKKSHASPDREAPDSGNTKFNEKIEEFDENIKAIGELKTTMQTIEVELEMLSNSRDKRSFKTNNELSGYEKKFLKYMDITTNILKMCEDIDVYFFLCDARKLTDLKELVQSIFNKIKNSGKSSNTFRSTFYAKKSKFDAAVLLAEKAFIQDAVSKVNNEGKEESSHEEPQCTLVTTRSTIRSYPNGNEHCLIKQQCQEQCSTVNEEQCNTVNEEQCVTVYEEKCNTVNKAQCSMVNEKQCNTVNEEQCSMVNEEQCNTVNEHSVPVQQCKNVPRQVCNNVPRQQCKTVTRQVCKNIPQNQCNTVPRQVCKNIPRQQCTTVPRQKCGEQCKDIFLCKVCK